MQNAVSRQKIAVLRVLWLFDVVKRCDKYGVLPLKSSKSELFIEITIKLLQLTVVIMRKIPNCTEKLAIRCGI